MQRSFREGPWNIETEKGPILGNEDVGKYEDKIGIPMPEMVFGSNFLRLTHKDSGKFICFNAFDALSTVKLGEPELKLAHTDVWKASKKKFKSEVPVEPGQTDYDVDHVHNPYDWTYSIEYQGTTDLNFNKIPESEAMKDSNEIQIPYTKLQRKEPIMFFDDVMLYEDELGDFGICTYSVKIRVMQDSLFLLARMFMRADNVAFRIRDTRVFVDFKLGRVIREYTEKQGSYAFVKDKIPLWEHDFSKMMRDPQWVDTILPLEKIEIDYADI